MESAALIAVALLALPAAAVAAWRFWMTVPRSGGFGTQLLDAIWTLAPLAFLLVLIVAAA